MLGFGRWAGREIEIGEIVCMGILNVQGLSSEKCVELLDWVKEGRILIPVFYINPEDHG